MEGDDADAALTWEALQSVGSDENAVNGLTVDMRTSHATDVDGNDVHEALDADDPEAFPPLDELPSFAATTEANLSISKTPLPRPRSKRKNFSKHLQFRCLERYVQHLRLQGKLPERSECQLLLHQSFAQFVREGGSDAHPRLSYDEFLKLIRNRSSERQRRLRARDSEGTQSGKRKHVDEYDAKINDLIEEIDRVRRSRHPNPVGTADPAAMDAPEPVSSRSVSPITMIDTILRLQQDTQRLQHQLHERLVVLQDQLNQYEPSSASV